ncbi:high-affinity branched-chain amino acid ABC transporter permease LivM [Pseudovibrio brasiliensis]|uniref:High-affinity branched-chain amino acid ABC transporter permease LivM n=1 Tax=Pseudovibrio brasiliensis TaxID=1898042 RepID=A0ABX8AN98_9HYPH|nr:high-affinity branched-chain amino acid ABC transporter permease LivM [Pseudovibrio brasiliensis]QUS54686.1 high-affinity branched-chain amino acid ABC transporter permease LivM [Pseudovibrio brasiliensis]
MQARQRDSLLVASLKDSLGGAVITFALACVMVGLKVDVASGRGAELFLEHRWLAVATAVIVVFAGRFLLNMFFWKREDAPSIGLSGFLPKGGLGNGTASILKYGMLILAVALPFALMFWLGSRGSRQYIDLAILVLTYVMLGWGLNIVVGLAGLLDLGYVAFYAVGAYSYALLAHYFGFSFWICLPLAGILAAFWGIILGFPVLRLRGDYLAIVTLAFGEIIRVVLLNWYEFTGGPDGLSGIPRPSFFGLEFTRGEGGFADFFGLKYNSIHRIIFLYYLIFIMAMLTNFVTMRLRRMPIGRAWEALREDEIACRALGINTTNTKLTAFALGAMFGGFAGSFFATRQGFISPESFTFLESAIILAIVVLGGLGSQMGVVIAAVVMIGGFEFFREFEEYRMLVFGMIMVVIMVWKPRGLVSSRTPSVALSKNAKGISADLVQEGHG